MGFQFDSVKALELHKRKAAKKKKSKSNPIYYIKGFYRTQGKIKDSKERFLLEFIHDDEDEEDKKAKLKSLKVSKDLLECFKGSHRTITHTLSKTEMNEGKKLSAAKKNNKRKRTARGNSTVSELSI